MNADYQALTATGLNFRIASQHSGWSRAYAGAHFVTFRSNNMNAAKLESKAPNARPFSHLGLALRDLLEELDAVSRELARVERAALSEAIQAAPSRRAVAL